MQYTGFKLCTDQYKAQPVLPYLWARNLMVRSSVSFDNSSFAIRTSRYWFWTGTGFNKLVVESIWCTLYETVNYFSPDLPCLLYMIWLQWYDIISLVAFGATEMFKCHIMFCLIISNIILLNWCQKITILTWWLLLQQVAPPAPLKCFKHLKLKLSYQFPLIWKNPIPQI